MHINLKMYQGASGWTLGVNDSPPTKQYHREQVNKQQINRVLQNNFNSKVWTSIWKGSYDTDSVFTFYTASDSAFRWQLQEQKCSKRIQATVSTDKNYKQSNKIQQTGLYRRVTSRNRQAPTNDTLNVYFNFTHARPKKNMRCGGSPMGNTQELCVNAWNCNVAQKCKPLMI